MRALRTAGAVASEERGTALVMTLLVLVVLTGLGMTLVALGMTEGTISSNWRDYSKDFYAAEAATESGVVALRNLLASTPTPTQTQLDGIATPPSLSDPRMTFGAYSITAVTPTAYRKTFATGPYSGLFGWIQDYRIGVQVNGQDGTRARLNQVLQYTRVPLFQFGIFYGKGVDLEISPGPSMTLNGRIHANSNIYIQANSGLSIDSYVTTAGGIYRTIKRNNAPNCDPCTWPNTPYPPSNYNKGLNDPQIKDASGTYQTLSFDSKYQSFPGSQWASQTAWASHAETTFQGRVKDGAMGVGEINLPLPELFLNPSNPDVVAHKLIEVPNAGDSTGLATAKMHSQAGLRIVDGVASDKNGNPVSLPANAITTRAFYDARESKMMTTQDLDVGLMRANGTFPSNGVVYVASTNPALNPVVRLINGAQLPSQGLTVVSQNPIYIKGDYNSVDKVPAAILGDAITVLSNQWNDSNSTRPLANRKATAAATVNAAFATGPSTESTQNAGNGQVENVIRFLEDWQGQPLNYAGSIVALWHSQQVIGAWQSPGTYYYAPARNWSYDTLFDTSPPPGTPMGVILVKGQWSQL